MSQQQLSEQIFVGNSEMAMLMRSLDWSQTPLGAVETWAQSLRTIVPLVLNSRFPMVIWWGKELVLLYNDAWQPILGTKHPQALGRPGQEVWSEIWDIIGPQLRGVLETGEATWSEDMLLLVDRYGYTEETYFTYSYSPVFLETGEVGGAFTAVTETTQRVIGERRLSVLRELAASTGESKTVEDICHIASDTLESNPYDIPFALLYLVEQEGQQARLVRTIRIDAGTLASPKQVDLTQAGDGWKFAQVKQTGEAEIIDTLVAQFGMLSGGAWDEPSRSAIVLPITTVGQKQLLAGFLVLGISPRHAFDDAYRGFFDLVASNIATAIANAQIYEIERKRIEALAELDRAKITFFSSVSHEFRTPLTLMLSPLEEMIANLDETIPASEREQLQLIQRNGMRLLKLVNSLLDFSRIEAGRVQAAYEPLDLAIYTADLASTFRSLIERAGMSLVVDCPALPEAIYVDRDMWEKIVLNLLSNAFKFTLAGTITIRLRWLDSHIELLVADTGVGIPSDELPHLFKRFYRVGNSLGRSFEGSGIGLSLVQELVKLHGGAIEVTSVFGEGSCFTVTIPTGTTHLPLEGTSTSCTLPSTALGAMPYVVEAQRWLPDTSSEFSALSTELNSGALIQTSKPKPQTSQTARILLADDNADMRDYIRRLLSGSYRVETVADGVAALAAIQNNPPDLVLTDVMMPGIDGFELLRLLRNPPLTDSVRFNPTPQDIPVILLSARAGEESRIEGLEAGADDYLIKPFSARELLARVEATLKLARLRREATVREQIILNRITDAFMALDIDFRFTYANEAAQRVSRTPLAELLGRTMWEAFPATVGNQFEYQYRRSLSEQVVVDFEEYYAPFDLWVEVHAYPSLTGLSIFFRDINDRKQSEATLRQSEERYRTLFESIDEGFCVVEMLFNESGTPIDYRFLEVNPVFEQQTGLQQAVGKTARQLVPNLEDDWIRIYGQVALTGEPARFENGSAAMNRWFDVYACRTGQPEARRVAIVFKDISKRKQGELALRENEQKFRTMADHAPFMVWVTDPTGHCTYLSQSWYDFTGQTEASGLGLGWLDMAHPDDRQYAEQTFLAANQRHEAFRLEYRLRRRDGEYLWAIDAASPWFGVDGQFKGYIGSVIDISDRKHIEETLRQRETELRLLTNAIPALVSFIDSNQCYRFTNHSYEEWFGHSATEIYGKHMREVLGEAAYAEIRAYIEQVLAGQQVTFESQVPYKDGGTRYVNATYVPRFDPQGTVEGFVALVNDISDRKQAEEALRLSEERFQAFMNHSPAASWITDREGRILYLSQTYFRTFQFSTQDVIGKTIFDVYPAEIAQQFLNNIQQAADTHEVVETSEIAPRPDGTMGDFLVYKFPIADQPGAALVGGVAIDVTDRKQAEAALRLSEERYRLISSTLTSVIWTVDSEGAFVTPQLQWENYTGQTWEDYQGLGWEQALHPEDREQVLTLWRQAIEQQTHYRSEGRLWHAASHEYHYFEAQALPLPNPDGSVREWVGNITDIHARKQAEEALRESEELKQRILESSQDCIKVLTLDGEIIYINTGGLSLLEVDDPILILNTYWLDSWQGEYYETAQRAMEDAKAGHTGHFQGCRPTRKGTPKWWDFVITPVRNTFGQVTQLLAISRDITKQKQAETEREQMLAQEQAAREAAEAANRIKDEFLAVLSHELRSPLNPILGWSRLLQQGKLDAEKTMNALATIERNARLQAQLVDDLLDISRILQGKLALNTLPVRLSFVISAAIDTVRLAIDAKAIRLNLALDPDVRQVLGDAARLQQVVWNLLSNAAKFTPAGGLISVGLTQVGTYAQLQIKDNGIGIHPNFLPHVFEHFKQEDGGITRKFGGLGLGLAIVRQIVEMHGGTVQAESLGEGMGATFTVKIPLAPLAPDPAQTSPSDAAPLSLNGLRILIVDDEADMRELTEFILQEYGAEVSTTSSAQEALTALDQFTPDILISDIGMADVDGYVLMHQVRSRTAINGGRIPAIALTAYAGELDQKRAIAAGYQQHISKPIDPDELVKAIVTLLAKSRKG